MAKPVVVRKHLVVSQSMFSLRKALLVEPEIEEEGCSVSSVNKDASLRCSIQRNMTAVKFAKRAGSPVTKMGTKQRAV